MDRELVHNKRAAYDYEFLETFEGGLVLTGPEAKSAKLGRFQLTGAFLHVSNGELWLKNAKIAAYAPAGLQETYKPDQERKVLVRKRELVRLAGRSQADGLTLVPISVYVRRNLVKLKFALARGKKQYEKRAVIKAREASREDREYV